jgi:predicted CXXCH cytochrome family protein
VKKILSALLAVSFLAVASAAIAAAPPETVTLKAKSGDVTFNHKAHVKQGCKSCHEGKPAKFELTKEKAHALCLNCHKEKKAGPQDEKKCDGCHKKAA